MILAWIILALCFAIIGGVVFGMFFGIIRIFKQENEIKKIIEAEVKNADNSKRI